MPAITPDSTVGEILAGHPDLARELERRSLDYCCGGWRTLAEACADVGLDPEVTAAELTAATAAPPDPWTELGLTELVDHLESTHHVYLHAELPRLGALADKVLAVHGDRHPELAGIHRTFVALRDDLEPHLAKEEQVLFPMIRELAAADAAPRFDGADLASPISVMRSEHDQVGELLATLRQLTDGYTPPADGCASYQALYAGLAELESDTHLHVHKENNRLFPAVADLEASPLQG